MARRHGGVAVGLGRRFVAGVRVVGVPSGCGVLALHREPKEPREDGEGW